MHGPLNVKCFEFVVVRHEIFSICDDLENFIGMYCVFIIQLIIICSSYINI